MKKNHEENIEEDIVFEDDVVEESGMQAKLKQLREELKAAKAQGHEYLTGWQKERADFANYKSQEEKSRQEKVAAMKLNLIADFFPVLDSFDMAFLNKEAWEKVDSSWRMGIEYIYSQLMTILESYDIKVIDQLGVAFDPKLHDPSEQVPTQNEDEDDQVLAIIQKGYQSGNLVIRPAKVKVGKYTA